MPIEVYDVIVMGAGFGGLHCVHRARESGLSVLALEAAPDTGGAWYWNRYPGARCDVESLLYSYSFSPIIDAEWTWSERYAGRDEICRYLQWVATRLDLRKDIRFNTRVTSMHYRKDGLWYVGTENGEEYKARFVIASPGPISTPILPDIPGTRDFAGQLIHTARWPKDNPNFSGKRVGVIGTGSSGTQLIPLVAQQCDSLTVFMRTRNYYAPAFNRPLTSADYEWWREHRASARAKQDAFVITGVGDLMIPDELNRYRLEVDADEVPAEERRNILEARWVHGGAAAAWAFRDVYTNVEANAEAGDFVREKVHSFVKEPAIAERLKPRGFAFGSKRTCVGTDFYETFERPNVHLVDVKETPIERVTATGVIIDGKEIALDVLICASGFDAVTGAFTNIDIRGEDGRSLKEIWQEGTSTYLGLSLVGFPNFYMIGGPGSPTVLSNVVRTNEMQVDWIFAMIDWMRAHGVSCWRLHPEAQDEWTAQVEGVIAGSIWTTAESWYVGANVPGKKRQILAYAGGFPAYKEQCDQERTESYPHYDFSGMDGSEQSKT